MEEKRNKFRILIENGSGLKIEKTNVNPALASNIINELLEQRPSVREREIPTPQEVERDVLQTVKDFQAPEEEYPEPTGRPEQVERGLLPKEKVKAVRIGGWTPKEKVGAVRNRYVPINFIRVAKVVMNELSKVRTRSIRVDALLKAVVRRYGTRTISGNYYSVINNLAKEMGYSIVRKGKHNRLYFNGVPKIGIKPLLKSVKKTQKLEVSLKARENELKRVLNRYSGKDKLNYGTIMKEWLRNIGVRPVLSNCRNTQHRVIVDKVLDEFGYKRVRIGLGFKKGVKTILLKKKSEERVLKRKKGEWKKGTIEDKIRNKLLELSEKGRKKIGEGDLLNSIKVNRSGTTYLLLDKIISNMGLKTIMDRTKFGKQKIIILKEGFNPKALEKYSDKERKIRNKLLEFSEAGKKEIFGGELIKSIGIDRSGQTYRLLDNIAKDMGFEVIKTGKARSCRKKIILKKEEPKGSRAYMSIYAKTLNEWEKIPTPFNLRQATFKLFGVMGGYNYNLTSMNVGQALNKLVRQGELVRKKVLGTVQASGKKGWKKEMWFYDLPKEGEEPQEVAPEPQEDIELPVVSEDTLISVFNQHIEISPKTFCGFYTKTGQPVTERQARFLFYWIRDNLSFVQGLTEKKIKIGGYGQWQTIKIR